MQTNLIKILFKEFIKRKIILKIHVKTINTPSIIYYKHQQKSYDTKCVFGYAVTKIDFDQK